MREQKIEIREQRIEMRKQWNCLWFWKVYEKWDFTGI
jgi:hypothetical protein